MYAVRVSTVGAQRRLVKLIIARVNGGTLAAPSSVMAVSALAVRGHSFTIRRRRLLAASRCPASRYAETRRQAVAEICAAGRLAATAAASAASRTLTVLARSPEFQ